jgi:hypothetical protein
MKGFTTMVSLRKFCSCSLVWIAAFFLMCGRAEATPIYLDTMTITGADPTQLGRLSRSGVPSDWSAPKAFPGVINTTTSYHYTTLDLDLDALEAPNSYGAYIQIDFDSPFTTTFLSAYLDSYSPLNLATNYLGDIGQSGNLISGDPAFFQVVVPSTHHLVLVLNETTTNGGLNLPGGLLVEAFTDTNYTDLSPASNPVPEPATWQLLMSGMAILTGRRFRRGAAA